MSEAPTELSNYARPLNVHDGNADACDVILTGS